MQSGIKIHAAVKQVAVVGIVVERDGYKILEHANASGNVFGRRLATGGRSGMQINASAIRLWQAVNPTAELKASGAEAEQGASNTARAMFILIGIKVRGRARR